MKIGIILGSTRPGRKVETVGRWVLDVASRRTDATFEVVDLCDFHLPVLDEETPPTWGNYQADHTKEWAAAIDRFDGFVFVTPEYNRSMTGALKNAIDYLYKEWNNKAAGFVSYGFSGGGVRAVEQLRQVMGELQIADVRTQVSLSLVTDFVDYQVCVPAEHHEANLVEMLDQLVAWSRALRSVVAAA
ncbi:NAD(P)H-dependent FMN reductase [Micromonospora auratinigra]|uniref:NAD(P)H-dependent FMN reductase n=2 Tax=Micromonospora auratinigra TaxID=261654 RepID=A0A1A8Z4M6_9ACTN|nr:NAD(P)H-dependent FMN reductase [Micromonospora auratinigra]